jgi:hypothetical protein
MPVKHLISRSNNDHKGGVDDIATGWEWTNPFNTRRRHSVFEISCTVTYEFFCFSSFPSITTTLFLVWSLNPLACPCSIWDENLIWPFVRYPLGPLRSAVFQPQHHAAAAVHTGLPLFSPSFDPFLFLGLKNWNVVILCLSLSPFL